MTFLRWVHRKLTHNSIEPMKNSTLGECCFSSFEEKNYYAEPTKTLSRSNINCQKPSNKFETNKVAKLFQEETLDPFEFLAIGTFGMELLSTDPPTPTLVVPREDLTNQQMEITENDIMLINYELEKFLEAEEKEVGDDTSESIILSNKKNDGEDSEGQTNFMSCPLQNYLFSNSIEVADPNKETKIERMHIDELFKRINIAHDDHITKSTGAEQPRKRNVAHFMKKVVKKFQSSSSSLTAFSKKEATLPISMKKKFSKALKMLHRKVHPEEMTEEQFDIIQKSVKEGMLNEADSNVGGDDENEMVGRTCSQRSEKNTGKLSSSGICSGSTNGGYWIRTDSDYLVLEL